ncbi:MAG TPA: glycosyltransferase family 87 protein [Candidatus Didemnitutus sp.]|jgi:hypothetical protein
MSAQGRPASTQAPAFLLGAAALAVWLVPALLPRIVTLIGFEFPDKWFLDSYAILASGDAVRAGINPERPNPLDILHRPHSYSDWWFLLEKLGLTRADNFAVGLTWVAVFLVLAVLVLRVRTYREALLGLVFLASPVVVLGVFRANNDLVIFSLIAAAALFLRSGRPARLAGAGAMVALATGLKFYPVVAGLHVILVRPGRRMLKCAIALAIVLGLVVWNVWSTIGRGEFGIPIDVHKTGLPILLSDLGLAGRGVQALGAAVIATFGLAAARRRWTTGLARDDSDPGARGAFLLGAVLLAACFVAGISHGYRWIFALLLVPWLRSEWSRAGSTTAARRAVGLALGLLVLVCWGDGLLCLGLNLFWTPQPVPAVDHVEKLWRLATQPLHWLLVGLLAGWLWDAVFAGWRAWREDAVSPR